MNEAVSQFGYSVVSNSCNPMDCSMSGFTVHHQLPELAQTHVHQVGDAIQESHPLSSPTPLAFNLSQHQGIFFLFSFFFYESNILYLFIFLQS